MCKQSAPLLGPPRSSLQFKLLKQMDKAHLSINLLNAILQYLGQRPYVEVVGLIKAIEQEAQPEPENG
jgi:hypothetical protein